MKEIGGQKPAGRGGTDPARNGDGLVSWGGQQTLPLFSGASWQDAKCTPGTVTGKHLFLFGTGSWLSPFPATQVFKRRN